MYELDWIRLLGWIGLEFKTLEGGRQGGSGNVQVGRLATEVVEEE